MQSEANENNVTVDWTNWMIYLDASEKCDICNDVIDVS